MKAVIRLARESDLPAIVALERATPELPHWPVAEYERYLAEEENRDRALFVAEQASVLSGFAAVALTIAIESVAELESLVVARSARRAGVGSELCRQVIAWSRGCASTLELEVRSQSAGAIALYESFGFRVTGKRPRYYSNPADDALLLLLDLEGLHTHL